MKNYFGFTLTGKKMQKIWMIFYLFLIVPYFILIVNARKFVLMNYEISIMLPILLLIIVVLVIVMFFISKLFIENLEYNGKNLIFHGALGEYLGVVFLGLFFSIITLGVYFAWYARNINRFFINNTSYDDAALTFKGKGSDLLIIYLLTLFVPLLIMTFLLTTYFMVHPIYLYEESYSYNIIRQAITWIIMLPYLYFSYKWVVNIDFKNYNIRWETNTWNALGKLVLEMFFCIITLGIYFPMFYIKMYGYFMNRTIADNGEIIRKFGFEKDNLNDFLFLWGEILLTIITLGIYFPWAISKIGARFLGRTYLA